MKKTPDIWGGDPTVLRVALCQVLTREWDFAGNLSRCLNAMEEAAKLRADVAVFPECVVHGYPSHHATYAQRMHQTAEAVDGPNMTTLRRLAAKLGLMAVIGFVERGEEGAIHNSAACIASTGEVIDVYRKVHCREFESVWHNGVFSPGDSFSTFALHTRSAVFTAGTIICFDREIPESVRCLRSLSAQIVFCPLACDTLPFHYYANHAHNEMITACRAAENEVFIVVVNHAGRFNGGSFVVGPGGEVLHQMGSDARVHVLDVPVGCLEQRPHRDPYGWMGWGFRRPEVYVKYLREPRRSRSQRARHETRPRPRHPCASSRRKSCLPDRSDSRCGRSFPLSQAPAD